MGKPHVGLNSKGSSDRVTLSSTAHARPPRPPALMEPAQDAKSRATHGWVPGPSAQTPSPPGLEGSAPAQKLILPRLRLKSDQFPMASHTADLGHTVLQGGPSSGRKQRALAPPWPSAANTKLQTELENLETCTEGRFHSHLRRRPGRPSGLEADAWMFT